MPGPHWLSLHWLELFLGGLDVLDLSDIESKVDKIQRALALGYLLSAFLLNSSHPGHHAILCLIRNGHLTLFQLLLLFLFSPLNLIVGLAPPSTDTFCFPDVLNPGLYLLRPNFLPSQLIGFLLHCPQLIDGPRQYIGHHIWIVVLFHFHFCLLLHHPVHHGLPT